MRGWFTDNNILKRRFIFGTDLVNKDSSFFNCQEFVRCKFKMILCVTPIGAKKCKKKCATAEENKTSLRGAALSDRRTCL